MEYITPRVPPRAQTSIVSQYGNLAHQPTMTSAGSTKMMAASVPAAEAMVCRMLFSWMVASLTLRKMAMEMSAAGMDVAKVRPALRPKSALAAVKISVMTTPMAMPRQVSSVCGARAACVESDKRTLRSGYRGMVSRKATSLQAWRHRAAHQYLLLRKVMTKKRQDQPLAAMS